MKTNFPFGEFDVSKMMAGFRMPQMPQIPQMDVESVLSAQRRNLEAMQRANQVAAENFQAIARRQVEMMQSAMEEAASSVRDLMSAGSPEEGAKRQSELVQRSMEAAVSNMRELAEMTARSSQELFDCVNQRFSEGLEEMRSMAPNGKAAGNGAPRKPAAKK
jgi:phasin family protein